MTTTVSKFQNKACRVNTIPQVNSLFILSENIVSDEQYNILTVFLRKGDIIQFKNVYNHGEDVNPIIVTTVYQKTISILPILTNVGNKRDATLSFDEDAILYITCKITDETEIFYRELPKANIDNNLLYVRDFPLRDEAFCTADYVVGEPFIVKTQKFRFYNSVMLELQKGDRLCFFNHTVGSAAGDIILVDFLTNTIIEKIKVVENRWIFEADKNALLCFTLRNYNPLANTPDPYEPYKAGLIYLESNSQLSNLVKKSFVYATSEIKNNIEQLESNITSSIKYDDSDVGNLSYSEIGEANYSQIILYGQSLGMGYETPEAITITPIEGNYMVGNSPLINGGNSLDGNLHPLKAVISEFGGEQPIVSCVNSFSKLYRRFVNKTQKFIGSTAGYGGQSVETLSKECTNTNSGTTSDNLYNTTFIKLLDETKKAVKTENVNCSAIIYMQGEHNYTGSNLGMSKNTQATKDKNQYKAYLKTLKDNMQADIMSKYNQAQKPLFFIYQTAGRYINLKDMPINMAQIEFAEENDDVFLLSSSYFTPDYNGGHLSTNGYRWYGEMIGKSLYDVFIKGKQYSPIVPMNFTLNKNHLEIDFYVPVLPLVFDTWTKESISNMGFKVFRNNSEISITNLEILNNKVIITCEVELDNNIEVVYGGQGSNGSGNLRDSDEFYSLYNYYDDRGTAPSKRENYTPKDKNGNLIYGKHYLLYNWCSNFYYKVK